MINQLGHPCLLYLVLYFANHLFEAPWLKKATQDETLDIRSGGVGHFKIIAD